MRKAKGNTKRAGQLNFWGKYHEKVPVEQKEWIYTQYFSKENLNVYTDMSMRQDNGLMAVACSYVKEGTILVKHQLVHPPADCYKKNVYGEMKAVEFALLHFEKYIGVGSSVVIYSDINNINGIIDQSIRFKSNSSLSNLQGKLVMLYQKKNEQYPNLTIQYLSAEQKTHNPFLKASHNASRKLLGM